ncbi:MAG: hypothetical protein Q8937_16910 [Bacteroidota bacterium]|nr:hypothetical protein [Bacteroidota bacterium]
MEILKLSDNKFFQGRIATSEEIGLLKKYFNSISFLAVYIDLVKNCRIIEQQFYIAADQDRSGMGVQMQWLTPNEQIQESFQSYPGIIVTKKDFLPIGACLAGSGDPYFLKIENNKWNIYRVLHDFAVDGKYRPEMHEFVIDLEHLMMI